MMSLEEEAKRFSQKKNRQGERRFIKPIQVDIKTIKSTILKLRDVRDDLYHQKVLCNDDNKRKLILEALEETDQKIQEYRHQVEIHDDQRTRRG